RSKIGWRATNTSTPYISGKNAETIADLRALGFDHQRRSGEPEPFAQPVGQIPLSRKMQFPGACGEHDKRRRTDGGLCEVLDSGLVFPTKQFHKAVQFPSADALRSPLEAFPDQGEQSAGAVAGAGRDERNRGVIQKFQAILDLFEEFL